MPDHLFYRLAVHSVFLLGALFALLLLAMLALIGYMIYSDLWGATKSDYRMLTPIDFPERTALIAEHQDEYITLPAFIDPGPQGQVICCWRFSYLERLKVLFTGVLWSSTMTFRQPLQPVTFSVNKVDVLREKK